jgi:outer membrane lipoprotein-sorting protein
MNSPESDLRKIDAIVLLFVTIIMFVVGYTQSAAIPTDRPVQNLSAKLNRVN